MWPGKCGKSIQLKLVRCWFLFLRPNWHHYQGSIKLSICDLQRNKRMRMYQAKLTIRPSVEVLSSFSHTTHPQKNIQPDSVLSSVRREKGEQGRKAYTHVSAPTYARFSFVSYFIISIISSISSVSRMKRNP